jgi:hypothetical protein
MARLTPMAKHLRALQSFQEHLDGLAIAINEQGILSDADRLMLSYLDDAMASNQKTIDEVEYHLQD